MIHFIISILKRTKICSNPCSFFIITGLVKKINRCHVKINLSEHGVEVWDQGSTNGTAINGEAFSPYHPCMLLQSGDTLTMGDVMLQAEIIRNTSY